MKIAILGTRGIPANYGGFETFAEECGAGLAARGHEVTVYCRSHYVDASRRSYRNVSLVVLPTLRFKYTDTLAHTFLSTLHSVFHHFDILLFCNAANSVFTALPRALGTPVVVNVDGIERQRRKWNRLGRAYYRFSEYMSVRLPNAIVADARVIASYYRDHYGAQSVVIPYGSLQQSCSGRECLDRLGVTAGDYFLYVSRFEPENNAHQVVAAFEKVRTPRRLIMLGDAPYARSYKESVRRTCDPRIVFPGALYGRDYRQLQANAFCYIHATEVGGSHPALIEAMGQGNLVVANHTPENEEVLDGTGILYRKNDVEDLARCMQEILDCPQRYDHLKRAALERARAEYCWDKIVSQYEELFARVIEAQRSKSGTSHPFT